MSILMKFLPRIKCERTNSRMFRRELDSPEYTLWVYVHWVYLYVHRQKRDHGKVVTIF